MSETPYDPNLISTTNYGYRRPVEALLHVTFEKRGLELIQSKSRALRNLEIHELMVTDEREAGPGGKVDRVSAVAFFEVTRGGLAVIGDDLKISGKSVGRIAGFDMTHMPNHMNVLVKAESLDVQPIRVGDGIIISRS
jgi:hypothetical protein